MTSVRALMLVGGMAKPNSMAELAKAVIAIVDNPQLQLHTINDRSRGVVQRVLDTGAVYKDENGDFRIDYDKCRAIERNKA